jgi:hypothetical protein
MKLIHILLPLYDNEGHRHNRALFELVARELTEQFGGLTAHTRAPAEGFWKEDGNSTSRDDIVIFEVMVSDLHDLWWQAYRKTLEERFRQEQIIVRAFDVQIL